MTYNKNRLFNFEFIDTENIKRILNKYDNKIIIENIIPITTGMSTSNYSIESKDNKYLLKVYPKYNDHSDIEIAAYKYAHSIIKVPEVLYFDNSKTIVDNAYAIFQYIDGMTLRDYVSKNKYDVNNVFFNIGKMLALLHKKEFGCSAILNKDLCIEKIITSFENQYKFFLDSFSGEHLNKIIKQDLINFIDENYHLIEQIADRNVFCHGDFNPSNIIIDNFNTPWFIDFEYCFSVPRYYDIGKLFRTRDDYSEYLNDEVIQAFANGYNDENNNLLPNNWYKLSKIADIEAMLAFINKEIVPCDWVKGIEEEIISTMNLKRRSND